MQLSTYQIGHTEPAVSESLGPIRALLLDDSQFDQRRVTRLANASGLIIQLDTATDIAELGKMLDETRYDVVFLDYVLPRGSGNDALLILRKHSINRNSAAVMIAGDDAMDDAAVQMRKSCDASICKDHLTADLLRSVVMDALCERSAYMALADDLPEAEDHVQELEQLIREIRLIKYTAGANQRPSGDVLSGIEHRAVTIWKQMKGQFSTLGSGHLHLTHSGDFPDGKPN